VVQVTHTDIVTEELPTLTKEEFWQALRICAPKIKRSTFERDWKRFIGLKVRDELHLGPLQSVK